jgi:hypothetical protein
VCTAQPPEVPLILGSRDAAPSDRVRRRPPIIWGGRPGSTRWSSSHEASGRLPIQWTESGRRRVAVLRAKETRAYTRFGKKQAGKLQQRAPGGSKNAPTSKQPGGRSGPATRTATGLGSVEWSCATL